MRKERGPGGMGRIVITRKKQKHIPPVEGISSTPPVAVEPDPRPQRRPRKSVPVRPQYREFAGRVKNTPIRVPYAAIAFVVLLAFYGILSVVLYALPIAFIIGFGAVGFGAGYSLYPLMKWNRREG